MKAVVDLELKATRTGPHDGGAGGVADGPEGPVVGEHATEGTTRKYTSCREHDPRDAANRSQCVKAPVDCGELVVDADVEAPHERRQHRASVSVAAAGRGDAGARSGEETARKGGR